MNNPTRNHPRRPSASGLLRLIVGAVVALPLMLSASVAMAQLQVITVPVNQDDTTIPHPAYNGKHTIFQAIARGCGPGGGNYTYEWDIDDDGTYDNVDFDYNGSNDGTSRTTSNPYDLGARALLPDVTQNTIIRSKIRVSCGGETAFGTFPVFARADVRALSDAVNASADELAVMRSVSADQAMWRLHVWMIRTTTNGNDIRGYLSNSTSDYRSASTAAALWAWQLNGHRPAFPPGSYTGPDPHNVLADNDDRWNNDPYAETVMRGTQWLLKEWASCTSANSTEEGNDGQTAIAGTDNGRGCGFGNANHQIYQVGHTTGSLAVTGPALRGVVIPGLPGELSGRTYEAVLQEIADWWTRAVNNSNSGNGTGWSYQPDQNFNDGSTNQWGYIGLEALDLAGAPLGVIVNDHIRARTAIALENSMAKGMGLNNGYIVTYRHTNSISYQSYQISAGALVAAGWLGYNNMPPGGSAHPFGSDLDGSSTGFNYTEGALRDAHDGALNFLARTYNFTHGQSSAGGRVYYAPYPSNTGGFNSTSETAGSMYPIYSLQKGARTTVPETTFVGGHDWNTENTVHLARIQRTDGSIWSRGLWPSGSYGIEMPTGWAVLALTASLFEPNPTAVVFASPLTVVEGCSGPGAGQVTFRHNESFHADAARNLINFQYDFDDTDGLDFDNADFETGDQSFQPTHTFQNSGTFTVNMRVVDDNNPAKTSTAAVSIVVQSAGNAAPTALAGGPYSLVDGDGLVLDGTGSNDPNENCGDTLDYAWDLDGDGTPDTTGANPTIDAATLASLGLGQGTHDITLTVTDDGSLTDSTTAQVVIFGDAVHAVIDAPGNASCPATVSLSGANSFQENPGKSIVQYEWDLDDDGLFDDATGVTTDLTIPTFGNFAIALRVTDSAGDTDEATAVVNANQGNLAPVAVPGGPYIIVEGGDLVLNGTASSDVNETNGCGDAIVNYAWDLNGDGTPDATGANPTVTQVQQQALGLPIGSQFPVTLTVVDSFGLENSADATAGIFNGDPVPVSSANPVPSSCNQAVTFSSQGSTHTFPGRFIVAYEWDFDYDGSNFDVDSTDPVASHTYTTYGVRDYALRVRDNEGNEAISGGSVDVSLGNQAPIADGGGPYVHTLGEGITLDASGSSDPDEACGGGIATYEWDLDDDGTIDFVTTDPTLDLTPAQADAIFGSGGAHTTCRVYVVDTLGKSSNVPFVGEGFPGDPTPRVTSEFPGQAPVNILTQSVEVEFDASGSFIDHPNKSIVSYSWDWDNDGTIDDTTPGALASHNFTALPLGDSVQTVRLCVTDSDGDTVCTTIDQGFTQPPTPPVPDPGGPYVGEDGADMLIDGSASFDPDEGPFGDCIALLEWDFNGDGTVDESCSRADCSGTLDCLQVTLTAAQRDVLGMVEGQVYTCTLTATDLLAETASQSTTLEFHQGTPNACFTASPNPAGCDQDVALDASCSNHPFPGRSIALYSWDTNGDGVFGDAFGESIILANGGFGSVNVAVQVFDGEAVPNSDSAAINVVFNDENLPPVAAPGGPYIIDTGDDLVLDGTGSSDPDTASCGDFIATYEWDFDGDGNADYTGASPTIPAAELAGLPKGVNIPILLTVTDSQGASTTTPANAAALLQIFDNEPVASFTANPNPAACNQAINFNSTSTHDRPDRAIVQTEWDFEDDGVFDATGTSVQHTYPAFGAYTVRLRVTDNNVPAKTDETTLVVNVNQGNQPPVAVLPAGLTSLVGDAVAIDASGSSEPDAACGDAIQTYELDLDGDGNFDVTQTGSSFSIPWAVADGLLNHPANPVTGLPTNTVVLRVTDGFGASNSVTGTLTVYGTDPVADVSADRNTVGCNVEVNFDGSSSFHQNPAANIVSYEWDFDYDGTFAADAAGQTTAHTYTLPGDHTTALRVTDDSNPARTSIDTIVTTVNVVNVAPVSNPGGPYQGFEGAVLAVDGSGSNDPNDPCDSIVSYEWDCDNDGLFGAEDTNGVGGQPEPTGAVAVCPPSPAWVEGLTFTIRLRVTDTGGETNIAFASVDILENSPPTAVAGGDYTGLEGQAVTLDGSGSSDLDGTITEYRWDLTNDGVVDVVSPTATTDVIYPDDFDGQVALIVVDSDGEPSQPATANVTIGNVAPTADAGPDAAVLLGCDVTLTCQGTDVPADTLTYQWDNGNGVVVDTQSITTSYDSIGAFDAGCTVTDDDGDNGQDTTTVLVTGTEIGGAAGRYAGPNALYTFDPTSPVEGQADCQYSLLQGPGTTTIDADSGLVSWQATQTDVGTTVDFAINLACASLGYTADKAWRVTVVQHAQQVNLADTCLQDVLDLADTNSGRSVIEAWGVYNPAVCGGRRLEIFNPGMSRENTLHLVGAVSPDGVKPQLSGDIQIARSNVIIEGFDISGMPYGFPTHLGAQTIRDISIVGNDIHDCLAHYQGAVNLRNTEGALVMNNRIWGCTYAFEVSDRSHTVKVLNNTAIHVPGSPVALNHAVFFSLYTTIQGNNLTFQNNIFGVNGNLVYYNYWGTPADLSTSNNIVLKRSRAAMSANPRAGSMAQWQNMLGGQDSASQSLDMSDWDQVVSSLDPRDPGFFRVFDGSAAIDNGADLGEVVDDFEDESRNVHDVGADEFKIEVPFVCP